MARCKADGAGPRLLPRLAYRELEALGHAIELLDRAHQALMVNRNSTGIAVGQLLYEAQQLIIPIAQKGARACERFLERKGVHVDPEFVNGDPEQAA